MSRLCRPNPERDQPTALAPSSSEQAGWLPHLAAFLLLSCLSRAVLWGWRVRWRLEDRDQMTLFWGFVAGASAVGLEVAYKVRWPAPWIAHLPYVLPLALLISYAIYQMVTTSTSLPAAVICFSVATLACRVSVSLWLGHPIGQGTWIAVGLMILATLARYWMP